MWTEAWNAMILNMNKYFNPKSKIVLVIAEETEDGILIQQLANFLEGWFPATLIRTFPAEQEFAVLKNISPPVSAMEP